MSNVSGRNAATIRNLIYRGQGDCIKCTRPVEFADAVLTRRDLSNKSEVIANQCLRHKWCGVSKYRPVHSPNILIKLIETMIADQVKVCPVCKTSWTNVDDMDDLILAEYRGIQKVIHATCL